MGRCNRGKDDGHAICSRCGEFPSMEGESDRAESERLKHLGCTTHLSVMSRFSLTQIEVNRFGRACAVAVSINPMDVLLISQMVIKKAFSLNGEYPARVCLTSNDARNAIVRMQQLQPSIRTGPISPVAALSSQRTTQKYAIPCWMLARRKLLNAMLRTNLVTAALNGAFAGDIFIGPTAGRSAASARRTLLRCHPP